MTDNQGERPEDIAPETPISEDAAETHAPVEAETPAPVESSTQAPPVADQEAVAADEAPAAVNADSVVPPRPPMPQQDAPGAQQTLPYGAPRPQTYAGQQPASYPGYPAPGYAAPSYPTAPSPHSQTQPTLPLGGAFGPAVSAPTLSAEPTAPRAEKKSGAGKVVGLIVAAALVGGAAGLGGAYAGVTMFQQTGTSTSSGPTTVTVNDTDSVNATTGIAAKVVPSVVTISASSSSGGGTGSGVILSSDGYVLTNTHVVTLDGATGDATISVTTSDGKVYAATVVGTDPTYDLAVIKLDDASGLTPIEFGDSSALNVGDQTVAVGAPLGLANTVTTGIVSALNRSIEIASSAAPESSGEDTDDDSGQGDTGEDGDAPFFFDFGQGEQQQQASESIKIAVIQTDAAINPGNSGGALVNDDGELIGINVAIASAGGSSSAQAGSIGVGFSIPSNIAQRVSDEIIENGEATHGLLGANVLSAATVDGATTTGAYIQEAVGGGAAAAAGLQEGDVVTEFNGVPITDSVDLTAQVRAAAAGSDATVTYVRDGKTQTTDVTLGTLEQ